MTSIFALRKTWNLWEGYLKDKQKFNKQEYSDTSTNDDNSFRDHIR